MSYYYIVSIIMSNIKTFVKEVFGWMCSLDCDKIKPKNYNFNTAALLS